LYFIAGNLYITSPLYIIYYAYYGLYTPATVLHISRLLFCTAYFNILIVRNLMVMSLLE